MQKVIRITNLKDKTSDYKYWMSRPEIERINAIELLRSQYIKFKNVNPRLQRVCRITHKTPGCSLLLAAML